MSPDIEIETWVVELSLTYCSLTKRRNLYRTPEELPSIVRNVSKEETGERR